MEANNSKKHDISKIMQKLQKPIIFALFSLVILLFVYSLIFFTPFYDFYIADGYFSKSNMALYGGLSLSDYPDEALRKVNNVAMGLNMSYFTNFTKKGNGLQEFDHLLFLLGFIGILISLVVFLFNGQKRKRYYLSNYITVCASGAYSIGVGVYTFISLLSYQNYTKNNIDYKTINAFMSASKLLKDSDGNAYVKEFYSASSFNYMFIIGYVICVAMVLLGIIGICYAVYKAMYQKKNPGLDLSGVNIDE